MSVAVFASCNADVRKCNVYMWWYEQYKEISSCVWSTWLCDFVPCVFVYLLCVSCLDQVLDIYQYKTHAFCNYHTRQYIINNLQYTLHALTFPANSNRRRSRAYSTILSPIQFHPFFCHKRIAWDAHTHYHYCYGIDTGWQNRVYVGIRLSGEHSDRVQAARRYRLSCCCGCCVGREKITNTPSGHNVRKHYTHMYVCYVRASMSYKTLTWRVCVCVWLSAWSLA